MRVFALAVPVITLLGADAAINLEAIETEVVAAVGAAFAFGMPAYRMVEEKIRNLR